MRSSRFLSALAACACLLSCGKQRPEGADMILTNGRIFTGGNPRFVEALAVRGDRILAAGTTQEIADKATSATRRIDLGGRLAIPGINDAHVHMDDVLPDHVSLNQEGKLEGMDPPCAQVLAQLRAEVKNAPKGQPIMGSIGPSAFFDARCTSAELDKLAPSRPTILATWTGHAAIFNRAAAKAFHAPATGPPEGGFYGKDGRAKAWDGVVQEYAWFQFQRVGGAGDEVLRGRLSVFLQDAIRYGITSLQAMSADPNRLIRLLNQLDTAIRVRVISFPVKGIGDSKSAPTRQVTGSLVLGGLKLILDGTPVERSMALRKPYQDDPASSGRLNLSPDAIRSAVQAAAKTNNPLLLHVVGDRAAELVLGAMEATGGAADWPQRRLRFEHGDGLIADLIPRAKALGVIVVQNPSHVMMGDLMVRRLGPERAGQMQQFRSLVDAGIPFALGSDGPLNPFLNMMFATTYPGKPKEALTREQAISAYTRWPAYAEFAEQEKGVLEAGKRADIAVLSQNILEVAPAELPKTESVLTIIGGKIVRQTF